MKESVIRKWCIHLHLGCKLNLLFFLCAKYSIGRQRATYCSNIIALLKFYFHVRPAVLSKVYLERLILHFFSYQIFYIFWEGRKKDFDLGTIQTVSSQHSPCRRGGGGMQRKFERPERVNRALNWSWCTIHEKSRRQPSVKKELDTSGFTYKNPELVENFHVAYLNL